MARVRLMVQKHNGIAVWSRNYPALQHLSAVRLIVKHAYICGQPEGTRTFTNVCSLHS